MQALPNVVNHLASAASLDTHPSKEPGWEYAAALRVRGVRPERRICKRGNFLIEHRGKHWAVIDGASQLVCLTVYKCGAEEVIRRLVDRI